jgi:hypothetical protein
VNVTNRHQLRFLVAGLVVALALAGIISYYASSSPDGLEKVAEDEQFLDTATDHATADSPLADYGVEGVDNERLSVGLAGVIGVVITAAIAGGLFLGLRALRGKPGAANDESEASAGRTPSEVSGA